MVFRLNKVCTKMMKGLYYASDMNSFITITANLNISVSFLCVSLNHTEARCRQKL